MVIWMVIKLLNKITRVSKSSETVTCEHDKKIAKERYISPEEKTENYW